MEMSQNRSFIAIDLKSFYASVECVDRGYDPLDVNLVVADPSRTEKTICLAVSPALKSYGIPGRPRLFEVVAKVGEVNEERKMRAPRHTFSGDSFRASELLADPSLQLGYVIAQPRMHRYMEISSAIYRIYLRYIAPEDIHVYSIDEVFIDATSYLGTYKCTAHELAMRMVREVLSETGITATAGIGTNMYLCKIAMDIVAKHMPADADGVRIAELDEMSYRRLLWHHKPITDFWRVGHGIAKRLAQNGMYTMGDVARCSVGSPEDFHNEELLYKLFGVNAELLIDHAWGYEPCTIDRIKAYRPSESSLSVGQVLPTPYTFEKARLVIREMADDLVLSMVEKKLNADQMVLTVGYDIANLSSKAEKQKTYQGEVKTDHYGRAVPKQAHGSIRLKERTSSTKIILEAVTELFERIVDPELLVRRMYVVANHVLPEECAPDPSEYRQLSLFEDPTKVEEEDAKHREELEKERKIQEAMLSIKHRYGKNALIKGMNLEEGATAMERNRQVGGHKA